MAAPGAAVPGFPHATRLADAVSFPPFFLPRHLLAALVLSAFPAGRLRSGRAAGGYRCRRRGGRDFP